MQYVRKCLVVFMENNFAFSLFRFHVFIPNSYITILLVSNVARPKWTGVFKIIYVPFICVSIDNKYSEKRIAV